MNKYNITIGADPELFVESKSGEVVSGIGLIPGSKEEPHPISDKGHAIQTDNIAWEFNIPPCTTEDEFVEAIQYCLQFLDIIAKSNDLVISNKASALVDKKHLTHPKAKKFGCDPDFDVYYRNINKPPSSRTNYRSCGGHVAVGYPNISQETSEKIVKMFDIFLTLPSLLMDPDDKRRDLYGKAGCFRFQSFGVEMRALSNFWIHSEETIRWVFRNTVQAVNLVLDGKSDDLLEKYSWKVKEIIDSNNRVEAKKLLKEIAKLKEVCI